MPKDKVEEMEPVLADTPEQAQDPIVSELEAERARSAMFAERLAEMERRIARAEFAGGNVNKRRQWDEIYGKDENIKYGFLPSMDGKDPIIDWSAVKGGKAFVNAQGYVQDDQSWLIETQLGHKTRLALEDVPATVSGNGIPIRINNWNAYRRECDELEQMRQRYIKGVGKIPAAELKALREETEERQANLKINVTLSEDNGKTYNGVTFDVLAKMLNAHR